MLLEQVEPRVALERAAAGEHLEDDHRQRVLVSPAVRSPLGRLLGRRVSRRSGKPPVILPAELAGQAQIEDLEEPLLRGADVLGLQVTVHDPPRMGKVECLRDRTDNQSHLVQRQPTPPLDQLAECFPFDKLENRERVVVLEAEVEDRRDCRMRQAGPEPGLLGERRPLRLSKLAESLDPELSDRMTLTATDRSSRSSRPR